MKTLFYLGAFGLILFEIANVYFIMPMPGSQKAETIDLAYFLYTWRWVFRGVFVLCLSAGFLKAFKARRIWSILALVLACVVIYMFNFRMTADRMFLQPQTFTLLSDASNSIPEEKLVLGYVQGDEARAYPIQLIAYHHQVLDTVQGEQIMVTYCSVCRTGRIFKPEVNGQQETFRLVGMDHFNAMFEDKRTRSWWRQETGEAVAGKLKGYQLPELLSEQMSLAEWLALYPHSLIMQYDTLFQAQYDSLDTYDIGLGRGPLTGTDTLSWNEKSWVIGIAVDEHSKAYDWNLLKRERIVEDILGNTPLVLVISQDNSGFAAFERPTQEAHFTLNADTLQYQQYKFDFAGRCLTADHASLGKVQAYQEFWHSWRTFHPETVRH